MTLSLQPIEKTENEKCSLNWEICLNIKEKKLTKLIN